MSVDKTGLTNVDGDDFSLDDIDDLPGFKCFPTGAFRVRLVEGLVTKTVGTHQAEECKMTLIEVLEVSGVKEGEDALNPGDICSTVFMRDNATALGKLKEFCAPFAKAVGSSNYKAIKAATVGAELLVVGKRSHDDDKDRDYFNISKVALV